MIIIQIILRISQKVNFNEKPWLKFSRWTASYCDQLRRFAKTILFVFFWKWSFALLKERIWMRNLDRHSRRSFNGPFYFVVAKLILYLSNSIAFISYAFRMDMQIITMTCIIYILWMVLPHWKWGKWFIWDSFEKIELENLSSSWRNNKHVSHKWYQMTRFHVCFCHLIIW